MKKLMILSREVRRKLETKGRLFEYQVLTAIHNIQVEATGSPRSPKYASAHWKFASRPQIMKVLGLGRSRSLERRIKRAVEYLSKIGHLAYWVGTVKERAGKKLATRFWICFDAVKYLFTVALNHPLFSGGRDFRSVDRKTNQGSKFLLRLNTGLKSRPCRIDTMIASVID